MEERQRRRQANKVAVFFSFELRDPVILCIPEKYQAVLKKLLQPYSIILRAVSSSHNLNVLKLKDLTTEFALFLATNAKWVDYSIIVDSCVFHAAELVE